VSSGEGRPWEACAGLLFQSAGSRRSIEKGGAPSGPGGAMPTASTGSSGIARASLLAWRVACEALVALFRVSDDLRALRASRAVGGQ